jgi:hypothetical protein
LNSNAKTSLNTIGGVSLSFGSDTKYLSETYVIIDAEVKRQGSLTMGSLQQQEIITAIMLSLDEQAPLLVFFPL